MSIKREGEFTKGDKYKQNLNLLTTRRVNILRRDHVLFYRIYAGQGVCPAERCQALFRVAYQHSNEPAQTISAPCQKAKESGALSSAAASAADNTGVK